MLSQRERFPEKPAFEQAFPCRRFDVHTHMELTHLQNLVEVARKMKLEPEELLSQSMPKPLEFKSQVDYVRQILAEQVPWNASGTEIGPVDKLPENPRYKSVQEMLNAKNAPSEEVIDRNRGKNGKDYRLELKGEHPVRELRSR